MLFQFELPLHQQIKILQHLHNYIFLQHQLKEYQQILQTRGRECADLVVSHTARVLQNHFRSVDHICRLREDEFAVIMTRITRKEKDLVSAKIDQINRMLPEAEDGVPSVRVSVGVAFSDRENPAGDIFEDADTALARLKSRKQTGYAFF